MQATSVDDPRPFRTVLAVAVALLLGLLGFGGLKSYQDLESVRRQERRLEAEIASTRERIQALDKRVRLLEDDPLTLERLAREELWMARPDDVVIMLPAAVLAPESGRGAPPPEPDQRSGHRDGEEPAPRD